MDKRYNGVLDHQKGRPVLSLKHNLRGMTLVEVLVAVAIVAILYAAVAPNFSIWIQNTRIRNAAESIQNGLNMAKTEAVHRNTMTQFVSCGGSSWNILAVSSVAASAPVCATTANGWEPIQGNIQTDTGPSQALVDITEANGNAQTTIGFNGLGRQISTTDNVNGGTTPSPPLAVNINVSALPTASAACSCPAVISAITANCGYPVAVPHTATGNLRCLRITVSNGGLLHMCDPALPANTPQGC